MTGRHHRAPPLSRWRPHLLAVVAAVWTGVLANTHKVTDMTRICVEHGFGGWDDGKGCFR